MSWEDNRTMVAQEFRIRNAIYLHNKEKAEKRQAKARAKRSQ